jgi:hypothetical protein
MMHKHVAVFAMACALSVCALAQDSDDASINAIVYRVKAGDTFSQFAKRYLQAPVDMAAIASANGLRDMNHLAVGAEIRVPRSMLKHTLSKATVMSLSCASTIRLDNQKPLTIGAVLREGAVVEVPPECHVSLLLEDGSVIRLPSGAALKLSTLRKNLMESAPEVRLDLTRGRIELNVNKHGRSPSVPFEVKTPISVMGVRGTEFRVGYSPEDQSGQVEVLGGLVETRGVSDAKGLAVSKGHGVPVNERGQVLEVEKLLPPPTYAEAQLTLGKSPSYVLRLKPVAKANYYTATVTGSANLSGSRSVENLLAPEIFVSRLSKQAVFYQLASVSDTGLVGTEQHYAFCAAAADVATPRCSAVFDAPLADSGAMVFSLSRMVEGAAQVVVQTKQLRAKNVRFAVQGLPAGQYQWQLAYDLPAGLATPGSADPTVRQSGAFELIALPGR